VGRIKLTKIQREKEIELRKLEGIQRGCPSVAKAYQRFAKELEVDDQSGQEVKVKREGMAHVRV